MISNHNKFVVSALLIILAFLSVKCAKESEVFPPFEAGQLGSLTTGDSTSEKPDKLSILFASPQGTIKTINEAASISVIFNQPMVELTSESQAPSTSGPISFEPSIKGTYRWIGTRTLNFTPSDTLQYSKSYKATISKGLKAISGHTLPEDFTFSFSTPYPQLVSCYPENSSQEIGLQDELFLRFNQRAGLHFLSSITVEDSKGNAIQINARTISEKDATKLSEKLSEGNNYYANYVLTGGDAENLLLVKPAAPLTPGETYVLKFSSNDQQKNIEFAPFKPFSYAGKQNISLSAGESIDLEFSNSVSSRDIIDNLTISPKIDTTNLRESAGNYYSRTAYLYLPLKAATEYTLKLGPNFKDHFGNKLGKELQLHVSVGDYNPSMSIPNGHGLIENDLLGRDSLIYPSFPIQSINVESARLNASILSIPELIDIETGKVDLYSSKLLPTRASQSFSLPLQAKRNQTSTHRFDLQKVLKTKRSGIILFQLRDYEDSQYQRSLVQVTSFAVTAKFSNEGSLVFVSRLKDGAPVQNATVQLYQGKKLAWKGQTDKSGIVRTPDYENLGIKSVGYETPLIAFVTAGEDIGYTTSKWDDGIQPYRFDIPFSSHSESQPITGDIFTERGIYRAGETVFIKGVLREKKEGSLIVPKLKKYFLTIRNSRDEKVLKKLIQIDPTFASFSDSLKLPGSAPLGYYSISLSKDTSSNYNNIADKSFRVEAYRPATFAVTVKTDQPNYISGGSLKSTIEGRYLFGAAMSEDKVRWSLQRTKIPDFGFKGYDGYFWQMLDWNREEATGNSSLIASGSGKLNREGLFSLSQKLDLKIEEPSFLTVEAEVTDPSRQAIAGRTLARIHPASFYIGLKPEATFTKQNATFPIDIVTLTPDAKVVSKSITVEVIHRQWISVKRGGVGGRYEWVSEKVDTTISRKELQTDKSGHASFAPKLPEAGLYFIRANAKDENGNVTRSETYTYVYGNSYVAWERFDDDRIELTPNKKSYKPGETANILIQSPYETATALMTIEREGILEHRVFELKGTAPAIQVPIKASYLPNVYISVMLFKGRTARPKLTGADLGKPSFRIGYAKLSVDPGEKHLQVEIRPNKTTYQTGEYVEAEVRVKDAHGKGIKSEVTLAAVDAGVLNLIGYELPDLFNSFYEERPLGVSTSESLLHLIEQRSYGEKGEARGGGGGEGAGGLLFRQNFVATAYWNPTIITDENGKATVRFKLPDNLTTFRLMASGQSVNASFGATHTDIVVNKPLSLLAALPRFARIGDHFEAGVVVHNYTKAPATISISQTATGIKSEGEKPTSVSLEAGGSKEVRFKFEAEIAGTATFSFVAKSNQGHSDAMKISIPILTPYTKETLAIFGSTENSVSEVVKIPNTIYPGVGEVNAQASSTALVGLREAVSYLFDYPYGCLEQKSSQILPYILANDLIHSFGLKTAADTAKGGAKTVVEKTLGEFEKYQTYTGGFSYWPGDINPNPYVSVYAAYTLTEAKAHGFNINNKILAQSLDYIKELLIKKDESMYGFYSSRITKSFALYVLAMNQRFDYSAAELLFQDRAQLPIESRGYLLRSYAMLKKSSGVPSAQKQKVQERIVTLSQELMNTAKVQGKTVHFEDGSKQVWIWTLSSPVKTTSVILSSLIEADASPEFTEKITSWLLGSQKNGRWRTTQENLFVLDALNRYFTKYEAVTPDFKAQISVASQNLIQETFKGRSLEMKTGRAALDKFSKGEKLSLKAEKSGAGKLFYGVRLSYYPTYALQPQDNGISIVKEISPLSPRKGSQTNLQAGEIVKVTLKIAVPEEMHFVAVTDPLPAGLEAMNQSLKTTASAGLPNDEGRSQRFDHIELHDDRVSLFATELPSGVHTCTYYARATSYGKFTLPPSYAEQMYQPEVFGRTGTARVTVMDLK